MLRTILACDVPKAYYTCEEFAHQVGLAPATVRMFCLRGQLNAEKRAGNTYGCNKEWALAHSEIERYQRDGKLPARPGKTEG